MSIGWRQSSVLAVLASVAITSGCAPARADEDGGYDAVLEALEEAGAYVEEQTEPGSIDRAQGYRYALRRIEMLNGWFLSERDGWHPTIDRCPTKYCKYGFDNPDAVYNMIKPLDPDLSYRLRGNRGTVPYVTFQLFSVGAGGFNSSGTLEFADMEIDEKGNFEILVGQDNPDNHPNFVQMNPGQSAQLLVRQMLNNWNTDKEASLAISVIDPEPDKVRSVPLLDQEAFEKRAMGLANFLTLQMKVYREMLITERPNHFEFAHAPFQDGGFPTNFINQMPYGVGSDEAVVIEIPEVDVVWGNIQLGTLWGESPDYATRLISYNNSQAHLDQDGVYRYVIAQVDPGTPNWLDAAGNPRGGVFVRWQTPSSEIKRPTVTRMKLDELRGFLPETHPVVTQAQRAEQLRMRMAGYNRRMHPFSP